MATIHVTKVAMPGFTPPQFLRALLNRAYFPTELPPVVTAKYFSEFCRDNYASLRTDLGNFLRLTHPLSQLGLSLAITQNRGRIRQIISSKPHSVYSPDENPSEGRAFAGLDFRRREIEAARIGSQCEFVLRADISRFFYALVPVGRTWKGSGEGDVRNQPSGPSRSLVSVDRYGFAILPVSRDVRNPGWTGHVAGSR